MSLEIVVSVLKKPYPQDFVPSICGDIYAIIWHMLNFIMPVVSTFVVVIFSYICHTC